MKRAIYPLYTQADESRVRPILDALKQKGCSVRGRLEKTGKEDALLLFLSKNVSAEGPEADDFFRLNAGRALVIPVNLDGSTPPEALQSALMARHGLDGTKYGVEELAERVARAAQGEKKSRLPLVLSLIAAAALLTVGGLIWWKQRPQPEPEPVVVEATATPTATPAPSPTATPEPQIEGISVDLDSIAELVIVGDRMVYYTWDEGYNQYRDSDAREEKDFAYGVWQEDSPHYYSTEDGHEFPRTAHDLSFLPLLKNLKYLELCLVDGELPDLSGLEKLKVLLLNYCTVPDLEGLRGNRLNRVEYHGWSVSDFSPLSDCPELNSVDLDIVFSPAADFSRFCPPKLKHLSIANGDRLSTIDLSTLSGCRALYELSLARLPIADLSFLSGCGNLSELSLYTMEALTSLSGLEGTNLLNLDVSDCSNLSDISALEACKRMEWVNLGFGDKLTDLSALGKLPKLTGIGLWGDRLQDLDFLREMPNKWSIRLNLFATVQDHSALEAVGSFESLSLSADNHYAALVPYLAGKSVGFLEIFNPGELDLAALPRVTGELALINCRNRDLTGLGAQTFNTLRLENCPNLRSLAGMEELTKLGKGGSGSELSIRGCPRLTDWSALEDKTFETLTFMGTYMLPDLTRISFHTLVLDSTVDMTDLSCLDGINEKNQYSFVFRGLDQVTSLQPLFRLHGDALEVPPQLQAQGQDLVDKGQFKSCTVVYPDGSWEPDASDVTLLDWEELDSLPPSVLKRVRDLALAGDVLVNNETMEVYEDRDDNGPFVRLRDRNTGEETRVDQMGTVFTDLSRLSALTGLENLALFFEPVTDLEGIQALENLKNLQVKYSPDLTDASAAFTVQTLERVDLSNTGLVSLQGIQNLPALRELYVNSTDISSIEGIEQLPHLTSLAIAYCPLTDMSPLTKVDYRFCMQEENGGGFTLEPIKPREGWTPSAADYAPLSAIPAFNRLGVSWIGPELWMEAVQNASIRQLDAQCGGLTTNEELLAFVAAHPELEEIQLTFNEGITDMSCLLSLEHLRYVEVNASMATAIASLGDGYGFELNIRDD